MSKMINIAKDFSPFAAGRYITDGPWSGERFREELLRPALEDGGEVSVVLDGTLGLGSSFLEEAFGGLVRAGFKQNDLRRHLTVIGKKKSYVERVWDYIENAHSSS
ncbi:STAS-like domain-containing protein [Alcaligenes faecalis]|uniref:STAS-like domain-containing protein n=1 Tax=Alcaligenes faecalis TaxID=511 RepID=UPI0034D66536